MLKLKCSFKRLRQLGLQIWCLTKVRTRPAGRIGDCGNFFLSFSPKAHDYYPTYHIGAENSLHENVL